MYYIIINLKIQADSMKLVVRRQLNSFGAVQLAKKNCQTTLYSHSNSSSYMFLFIRASENSFSRRQQIYVFRHYKEFSNYLIKDYYIYCMDFKLVFKTMDWCRDSSTTINKIITTCLINWHNWSITK